MFRTGGLSIAHPNAYIKGWEQSLQPYVTTDFTSRFPYSFDCRSSDLCAANELYATPYISKLRLLPLLFYNTDLLGKYATVRRDHRIAHVVNSFAAFDIVQVMTQGGPAHASDIVETYIFRYAFNPESSTPRYGFASAAALLFGLAVLGFTVLQTVLARRRGASQGAL